MSPCRTVLVGLLVVSYALVQADISHLYNVGNMATNLPSQTPFWWMNDKSPFKRAILGCNNGNCAAQTNLVSFSTQPAGFASQQQQQKQLLDGGYELNPFLNAGSKSGSINMYLPPRDPEVVTCQQNQVCVTRASCASGFILSTNVPFNSQNRPCAVDENEVCCRVQVPAPPPPPPPPPPTPTPVPSIPCNQPNYFCVPPQACNNGVIFGSNNRLQSAARCFGSDVCCRYQPPTQPPPVTPRYIPPPVTQPTTRYIPPQITTQRPRTTTYRGPDYIPPRIPDGSNIVPTRIGGDENKFLPIVPKAVVGCAAAMNCTAAQYCDALGVISKTPVVLTKQQELFRVPVTACSDLANNIDDGVCCRDPDYTDPWPVTVLGQYNRELINAAFDDGSYKAPSNTNFQGGQRITTNQRIQTQTNVQRPVQRQREQQQGQRVQQFQQDLIGSSSGSCGVRHDNAVPRGAGEFDTGFGEYTWQAMVLMQSNRSLLCGGVIIDENTVATAAHCVQGVNPSDLKIKCGEWKLGIDDEPKPFQITGVRAISYHPAYNPTNLNNDVALLHCNERIRYDQHIGPICLEDQVTGSGSSQDCVTTGWGKEVLRIHLQGAIMNQVPMKELSQNECSAALSGYGYNPQSSTCCQSKGGDACLADVGSALACRTSNGNYVLKGVYSTETECNSPNQLVSFAKMDINWVRQSLRGPPAGHSGGIVSSNQFAHGVHNLPVTGQASQTIKTVFRQEVVAQPNAPHVYSVPSQAPLYLPPL